MFTSFSGQCSCADQRNPHRQPTDSVQRRLQLLQTIPEGKTAVQGELHILSFFFYGGRENNNNNNNYILKNECSRVPTINTKRCRVKLYDK